MGGNKKKKPNVKRNKGYFKCGYYLCHQCTASNCRRMSCCRYFGWCGWNQCLVELPIIVCNISYNSITFRQVKKMRLWYFCAREKAFGNSSQPYLLNNLDKESSFCLKASKAMLACFSSKIFIFLSERKINTTLVTQSCVLPRCIP